MCRAVPAVFALVVAGCLDTTGMVDAGTPDAGTDPCAYDPVNGYPIDPACPLVLDDSHLMGFDPSTLPMGTAPCHPPQLVTVTRDVDGDTIRVDYVGGTTNVDIRFIGVNCPEVAHPPDPTPAECYGDAAASFTNATLVGHELWLTYGETCTDVYGRTLAFLNMGPLPNDSYQRQLMRRGFARLDTFTDNPDYASTFTADQTVAMTDHAGLWGSCP